MNRTVESAPTPTPAPSARVSRGGPRTWIQKWIYPAGVLALVIVVWQIATTVFDIPDYLLPPPTAIAEEMVREIGTLWSHGLVTLWEVLVGFALSVVIAIPLAILIVYSVAAERALYPLLIVSQVVPKVSVAPLFVVWLGFGVQPKVIIVFLIAFFPIVIDTIVGLRSVDEDMIDLVRSMGAGPVKTFRKIRLPAALPNIFGGLKVAITLAVVGALVAEFVGSDEGLGYLLLVATGQLNAELLFASIVFLSAMGMILFLAIEVAERLLLGARRKDYGKNSTAATM